MAVTLDEALRRYPGAQTFSFGDTPDFIAELTALVRSGKKRATCSSLAEIEAGAAAPQVGRRDIALGPDGEPALVIKTLELVPTTWAKMTEEMALMEGENETLEGWKADHRRYFERKGIFSEDMGLIWERFAVVEDFAEDDGTKGQGDV
ncbi:ASCH domain-containing protein [Sulfitobacter sp. D35]|uniref:ASCH domain-containing protein n=1 Tax=Sulfitobacter sp. D35 TaxID=3083252 RepID=UPI00296E75BB|nr:ASCH domain-containing protein [Sulfitobacter sp. D35]MDW4496908.1 ASCH domain-containing protein [Sulfitobacter sp. D35]